ncbi:hypothetical protein KA005_20565 [bacterium]|nr:hypothetical protein [bacterium]
MTNRFNTGIITLGIILVFSIIAVTGCPAPRDSAVDTENGQSDDEIQPGTVPDEPQLENEEPEITEPEPPEWLFEGYGDQFELTEEEVENISGFGKFMFPDAVLKPEDSIHQVFPEGSELYVLEFGVLTPIEVVADWYRDNLESGAEEHERVLGTGVAIINFQYSSPDETWQKSITVKGGPAESQCLITVNITHIIPLPEDEPE